MHSNTTPRSMKPAARTCSSNNKFYYFSLAPSKLKQHHCRVLAPALRAWQQVIDPASGKPYYWNTATNETAWELPPAAAAPTIDITAAAAAVVTLDHQTDTAPSNTQDTHTEQQQQQQSALDFPALFELLQAAYTADGSGMQFWEVARAHRADGVFDVPFFEYLEQQQRAEGASAEHKDMAAKMMCRLSNPLLRQPAPFEF